jgi:hypothetical protein
MATREEYSKKYFMQDGKMVTVFVRTAISPDEAYAPSVRAKALALRTGEAYAGERVPKNVKDYLIKTRVII